VSREKARRGFKVIYDCQGSIDGRLVPETCGRFQEAILGQGMLLPEFEKQLERMGPGKFIRFDITFPAGYGQKDLAGKVVMFRVQVHFTMEPMIVDHYENLDDETLRNVYELEDPGALRQHNINLYYKVLHGGALGGPPTDISDSLMLINLYLKLGFVDLATAVTGKLPQNSISLTHAAHVFCVNGQPHTALELLDRAGEDGPRARLVRAEALYNLDRLKESEEIAKEMKLTNSVQLADLRVNLAARLAHPMETFLEREEILLDAKTQALF
jgi:hypothetical protein